MKTYVRPMSGWWRRNPYYLWYMLREASSVFITAYALVLLTGLFRLAQGREAYGQWQESLGGAASLVFHGVTLVLVLYHAWTWFKVMPKTLPFLRLAGWRIPDGLIVSAALAASAILSAALLVAAWWLGL
jgi:fumarate reductase subunit C